MTSRKATRRGRKGRPAETPGDDDLWVRSDLLPNGSYGVTVNLGADHAVTLGRDNAVAYAVTVIDVANRAEYDAAVLRQLTDAGVSFDAATQAVTDLRADRPPPAATYGPFSFEPVVSRVDQRGRVVMRVDRSERGAGTFEPAAAREHATHVLDVLAVADLDAGYLRLLRGLIGLDEERARNVVGDLARYRT